MLAKEGRVAQSLAYTNANTIGSHLLLFSTSSEVLDGYSYEKTFCECLEVSKVFTSAVLVLPTITMWQVYHLARLVGKFVQFQRRGTH